MPALVSRQHRRAQARVATRRTARRCWWSCWTRPASRRASSTSSPARARRSATPSSTARTCTSSASPATATPGGDRRSAPRRRLKRVSLELGGKNAIVVHGRRGPRPRRRRHPVVRVRHHRPALHGVQPGDRRRVGRGRPGRPAGVADARLRLGSGLDETGDVGPLINAAAVDKVARYVEIGRARGRQLRHRRRAGDRTATSSTATSSQPTIFDGVDPMARLAPGGDLRPGAVGHPGRRLRRGGDGRQPGPLRAVVEHLHARREHGVPGDARLRDRHRLRQRRARSAPRPTCRSAAGRQTGNGHREAGHAALDTFTEWKSIYVDFSRPAPARPDRQPAVVT